MRNPELYVIVSCALHTGSSSSGTLDNCKKIRILQWVWVIFISEHASHVQNCTWFSFGKISSQTNAPSAIKDLCEHRIVCEETAAGDRV
jgi:hypothetical protein